MKTVGYLLLTALAFGYLLLFAKAITIFYNHKNQLKKFRSGLLNGTEVSVNNGQRINTGVIVRINGKSVTVLFRDGSSGGYGMNCIYPLIQQRHEYSPKTQTAE